MKVELTQFDSASAGIAEMATQYMSLTIGGIDDADGFKTVHKARMVVKNKRVEVEKVRKELKADALAYGREVDGEAKRIAAMLLPIETHLKDQEDAVNAEKERIKNAERLRVEAEAKAKKEAEDALIAAKQEAENERLRVERKKLESEQADLRKAQSKMDAEKKAAAEVENARQRAERIEVASPDEVKAMEADSRHRLDELETKAREADRNCRVQKEAFLAGWRYGRGSDSDDCPAERSVRDWDEFLAAQEATP